LIDHVQNGNKLQMPVENLL